jgi:hypothetical protein
MPKRLCNYPEMVNEQSARRLWYEILLLAIADLNHKRPRYRKRAEQWLRSEESDYCFLVMGTNPESAREKIFQRLAELPAAA